MKRWIKLNRLKFNRDNFKIQRTRLLRYIIYIFFLKNAYFERGIESWVTLFSLNQWVWLPYMLALHFGTIMVIKKVYWRNEAQACSCQHGQLNSTLEIFEGWNLKIQIDIKSKNKHSKHLISDTRMVKKNQSSLWQVKRHLKRSV